MIDLIQVQDDLYGILMSAPQLATVNIVEERRFRLGSELATDAIWQTIRNNSLGNGLLIELPAILCDSDSVTGPPQQVELSFVSFQNGDAPFTPLSAVNDGQSRPPLRGGGLYAEQIEQYLVDILHLLNIGGIGTLRVTGHSSSPARDYSGVNARRTKILMTPKQTAQTPRTAVVNISVNDSLCTLTTATVNASIYYTLDGSFPGNTTVALEPFSNKPVTPNSTLYTAPFAVNPGQLIRATAYLNGLNPGQIVQFQN